MTLDRNDAAVARQGCAFVLAGMLAALAAGVATAAGTAPPMRPASLETGPAARSGWTDPDIYDAEAYWHFARIDGFYRMDGRVVACVQKADGHRDFWDPRRDALLGTKNLDCLPPSGSRSVEPTIVSHPIAGAAGSVESDASFSGATAIWWQPEDFQHCDTAFAHVYTAEGPGRPGYGFYVLARRRHAASVDLSAQACSLVPGVVTLRYTPRYDDVARVQTLDLGDQRTLLVTRDDDDRPVVVVIHDRPSRAWTGAQGVSIVPAALLRPALDRAGPDYAARERAVAQVLDGSRRSMPDMRPEPKQTRNAPASMGH